MSVPWPKRGRYRRGVPVRDGGAGLRGASGANSVLILVKGQIVARGFDQGVLVENLEVVGVENPQDSPALKLVKSPAQGLWPGPQILGKLLA